MTFATFLKEWRDELPGVAATLTSAAIVFLVSLAFKPVRSWLFPSDVINAYPVICTAEPRISGKNLIVEFFVINQTGEEYRDTKLSDFLKQHNRDGDSEPDPAITLPVRRDGATITDAYGDSDLNKDKGELLVTHTADRATIWIRHIQPRAVLRVFVVVSGLPLSGDISRMAKSAVPVAYEAYQDACYTR
jgi:hypothetical protein